MTQPPVRQATEPPMVAAKVFGAASACGRTATDGAKAPGSGGSSWRAFSGNDNKHNHNIIITIIIIIIHIINIIITIILLLIKHDNNIK